MVQAVILDVDGTLVLSNDAHAQSWVDAFAEFGYNISFEQVRPLIGMGGDQVIPRMVPKLNNEEGDGKKISERRKELIMNKYGPKLEPTPGARELVQRLHQEGFKLIIASSATSQELEVLLKAAKVDDLLDQATTSSDADASKPEPDIVEAALEKIGVQPHQALMLGDTPYDIQAAHAAGVNIIALRCGGFADAQLEDAEAIYDDPADLCKHFEESPLRKT